MRAIVTTSNGNVPVMKVEERPDPQPKTGQVLIRVKAAGLNFADILARQGLYPDGPPKPCIMGYEVSGDVESVGDEVDKNFIGKSVIAMTRFKGQEGLVAGAFGSDEWSGRRTRNRSAWRQELEEKLSGSARHRTHGRLRNVGRFRLRHQGKDSRAKSNRFDAAL